MLDDENRNFRKKASIICQKAQLKFLTRSFLSIKKNQNRSFDIKIHCLAGSNKYSRTDIGVKYGNRQ